LQKKMSKAVAVLPLCVSPSRVITGENALADSAEILSSLGQRPLVVSGARSIEVIRPRLTSIAKKYQLAPDYQCYSPDCSENSIAYLRESVNTHAADFIIGVGGGKALDTAKLLAHQCGLAIATIPTSGATCAAWTALSNIYSDGGAFLYDVGLARCPEVLILDYGIIQSAPRRTLVAGIGDAIAKWYESSVSSGHATATLTIAAVQQARVLRDILFQKSASALENIGGEDWREVVDATVLLAGVIGGLGGANCRTVAAHAIHNGLTHIPASHQALHGEKVAYGILVQLRLEEIVQGNQLAAAARQQLIQFYEAIGLPKTLEDLGLKEVSLADLRQAAAIACQPNSDIHRLPFAVSPEQVVAALVSTTVSSAVFQKVKAE
jgi:glycerol dehydrogenase-like iron-containing ADH family enzyme